MKIIIKLFFLVLKKKNICCDPSLEPSLRDSSNVHNLCFYGKFLKIIPKLSLLPLLIWSTMFLITSSSPCLEDLHSPELSCCEPTYLKNSKQYEGVGLWIHFYGCATIYMADSFIRIAFVIYSAISLQQPPMGQQKSGCCREVTAMDIAVTSLQQPLWGY